MRWSVVGACWLLVATVVGATGLAESPSAEWAPVVGVFGEIERLDPHVAQTVGENTVAGNLFEGLVELNTLIGRV